MQACGPFCRKADCRRHLRYIDLRKQKLAASASATAVSLASAQLRPSGPLCDMAVAGGGAQTRQNSFDDNDYDDDNDDDDDEDECFCCKDLCIANCVCSCTECKLLKDVVVTQSKQLSL